MVFLVLLILNSLRRIAVITAPKNPTTILIEPIIKVLVNTGQKLGSLNTSSKLLKPIQGEATIPLIGLKLLKAKTIPYIGK